MPQDAASDKSLHCLLTENPIKNWIKIKKQHPTTLEIEIDWPIDKGRLGPLVSWVRCGTLLYRFLIFDHYLL